LHLPVKTHKHRVDYAGAGLLSASVLSLILLSVWAGVEYAWKSPEIIGLGISSIIFGLLFIWRERRAAEPVIPLKLFRNDIMRTSTLLSFITGMTMFASILYIPLYQQIVRGLSPTKSGLLMLPMVVGMFGASLISGQLITRTGRYRIFPIIGTLLLALGLWLFSHLGLTTSYVTLSLWMFIIGLGLGQLFQVPTLAVQNATPRENMGTATSTVTFFRSIGSALGGAIFGSILISRLTYHLSAALPGAAGSKVSGGLSGGLQQLAQLPEGIKNTVLNAYVQSFHDMFLIAIPFALLAFLVALNLREAPLRETHEPHISE
jgi:predicted MFS family arabinose efflux permease